MTQRFTPAAALALLFLLTRPARAEAPPDPALVQISGPASPRVAYGLTHDPDGLTVTLSVASFTSDAPAPTVHLGVSADRTLTLTNADARITRAGQSDRLEFRVPAKSLVDADASWQRLRVALAVNWPGGPLGQPRQSESFLQVAARAPHAGLSPDPADWQAISLTEFERAAKDRALQIAFDFDQPADGKATLVIEDARGRRVRNLIGGRVTPKGTHRIVWDGRDDDGRVVPPGDYRWRGISHPGLSAEYLFSYANGPGSNHGTFHAAASNGTSIFFGTPVSEGGFELVQLAPGGAFVRGFNAPNGHGLGRVAVAADAKYLYAAYDGTAWGQHVDRSKPDWQADQQITLVRFDLDKGTITDFGKSRAALIRRYTVGPGSPERRPDREALAGLVLLKGRLYLADGQTNEILDVDPATGSVARAFAADRVTALAASRDALFAIAANRLVGIDPATGAAKEIAPLAGQPAGLAVGGDNAFYVSDAQSHVVQLLDAAGKQTGTIGHPGGVKPGPYDPLQLHNPAGLVLAPDGHLWVTEQERWRPKRLAAFDPKTGGIWKEFFGPTAYGASGASFDPADVTRWIGQDTLFQLDFAAKTAKPVAILGGEDGSHYRFWRQDGRTFLITYGKASYIQELLPDKTLRPLACLSSAHQFSYAHDWRPPQAFVDAFRRDYPAQKYQPGVSGKPGHGHGMLWVDRNGDGQMQAGEIDFSTAAESLAGSGWGHDFADLTLRVTGTVNKKAVLVTLKPDGWWPGGAPKYPPLNDAARAGVPIDLKNTSAETTVDRFGNLIVNSDPRMSAFAPDGKLLWTYPNRWSGVHGSHDAPLPTPGELQGVLFFTGVAPLDEKADVVLMNGNHGRAFLMTTDGLYLDELFGDVRLMNNPQANGVGILGGECFGGSFGRADADGNYYFQGGGIEYRVYRVDGLRQTKRSGGALTVTADQTAAAERNVTRTLAATNAPRRATIPYRDRPADWPATAEVQWDRQGQFPVAVNAAHDGRTLFLRYVVRGDNSPWVNNGKDWQQLFKTGDGVDLQLGTDPAASATRTGPVPGDLRLFVAPFEGKPIAVLYRHRLSGATDSVVFQSPWRSEKVDSVKRLDAAKITVTRASNGYAVDLAVPLSELNLAPLPIRSLRADFGVIYGDPEGTVNLFRNYWSNRATGLVNDVPGEIMLSPNLWGDLTLQPVSSK